MHTCSDCGKMHVWFVGLSPVIIGGTGVVHLLIPYIPVLPYWACSTEMVVPGGHFSVIISSSHAARWKVFRVPDNKAVQLKKPARQGWHRKHRVLHKSADERIKSDEGLRQFLIIIGSKQVGRAIWRNRGGATWITGKRKHERNGQEGRNGRYQVSEIDR